MQRTPPQTIESTSLSTNPVTIAHCLSDPNLLSHAETELLTDVTRRLKRKREDGSVDSLRSEILDILKTFASEQSRQYSALQAKMDEIKEQNVRLQESVDFSAAKYEEISLKLQQIEEEKRADRKYTQLLEERVEQLERQIRSTSLEIRNVPQKTVETKENLVDTVIRLGNVVKSPIQLSDIKEVFRAQTKSQKRNIIAEFTSVITRDRMIRAIKTFNKENRSDRLNTLQLQIDGPRQPIYVSENLTSKAKKLFYLARDFAALNNYKYCWTSLGKVLLRKEDGATRHAYTG